MVVTIASGTWHQAPETWHGIETRNTSTLLWASSFILVSQHPPRCVPHPKLTEKWPVDVFPFLSGCAGSNDDRVGGRNLGREWQGAGQGGINPLEALEGSFSRQGTPQPRRLVGNTCSKQEQRPKREQKQSFWNIRCRPICH